MRGDLVGWKAIARFLGRDESTAKRWEGTRGMPVRRVPGGPKGSVFASSEELTAWLATPHFRQDPQARAPSTVPAPASRPPTAAWRRSPVFLGATGVLLVAALATTTLMTTPKGVAAPSDPKAADAYFAGVHALSGRSAAGIDEAMRDFRATISRDPNFGPAHVGLADTYALAREFGHMGDSDAYSRAEAEARAALRIDPESAGGHRVLGFVLYWLRNDREGSEHELRRAIQLEPDDARTHQWYANILSTMGRQAEALHEIDRARALDPQATAIQADRALILSISDPARARVDLERLAALDPNTAGPATLSAKLAFDAHDGPAFVRWSAAAARLRRDAVELKLSDAAARGLAAGGWPGLVAALDAESARQGARGYARDHLLALPPRDSRGLARQGSGGE